MRKADKILDRISNETEETGRKENRTEQKEWPEWELAKTLTPDRGRRERALAEIRREIAGKSVRPSPSWREIVWLELQYISPLFWVSQAVLLALFFLVLERVSLGGGKLADYLQWASIAAAWLGVLLYGNLGRHICRGMAELEQSCYFNLSQIWAIKMALAGAGDILILSLGCGRISGLTRTPFLQVIVYLLAPFVLSNVCCLLFFSALLAAMVPATIPGSYEAAFWWIWLLALSAGVAIFAWQIWLMYGKIERGEVLCWN